jgi:hypothetical protein
LEEAESAVQPALDYIQQWMVSAGLNFNSSKTQAVIFRYRQGDLASLPNLYLTGTRLDIVESVKYLGITLSSNLRFSEHVNDISKGTRAALACLRRKLDRNTSPKVLKPVYEACVRSKLDYGCCTWDPLLKKDIENLERVQLLALRLLKNNWQLDYQTELVNVGWKTLADRRKHLKLVQFYKFYNGFHDYKNNRLIHVLTSGRRVSSRIHEPHHIVVPKNATGTVAYTQSFEYSTIMLWNAVPDATTSLSLSAFKLAITNVLFS